jgi:hypothetical protein
MGGHGTMGSREASIQAAKRKPICPHRACSARGERIRDVNGFPWTHPLGSRGLSFPSHSNDNRPTGLEISHMGPVDWASPMPQTSMDQRRSRSESGLLHVSLVLLEQERQISKE